MSTQCVNIAGELMLPARSDIDGIGTRIATYIQLATSVITIALALDASSAFGVWWAILVTSLSLQVTAFVQASSQQLTLFHAMLVTLLSYPVFAMSWVYMVLHWRELSMPIETQIATHVHGFVFLGFGLYVWGSAPTFGTGTLCPPNLQNFGLFGASLDPTGPLRIVVLVIYGIWAVLFLLCFFLDFTIFFIPRVHPSFKPHVERYQKWFENFATRRKYTKALVTLYNFANVCISIILFELTVHANSKIIINASDTQWTLGQITAMIMLVVPFISLGKLINERWQQGKGFVARKRRERAESRASAMSMSMRDEKERVDEYDTEKGEKPRITEETIRTDPPKHKKQESVSSYAPRMTEETLRPDPRHQKDETEATYVHDYAIDTVHRRHQTGMSNDDYA